MSTGGPNAQRFSPFTPPLRGSFPLDRGHECDALVVDYLACLRDYNKRAAVSTDDNRQSPYNGNQHIHHSDNETEQTLSSGTEACRPMARRYFECRMAHGLMTPEDLHKLGYPARDNDTQPAQDEVDIMIVHSAETNKNIANQINGDGRG